MIENVTRKTHKNIVQTSISRQRKKRTRIELIPFEQTTTQLRLAPWYHNWTYLRVIKVNWTSGSHLWIYGLLNNNDKALRQFWVSGALSTPLKIFTKQQ